MRKEKHNKDNKGQGDWAFTKKDRVLLFLWMLFVFFVPMVIHIYSPYIESEISADGMLSYFGGVIAATGSAIVSIVALWQSRKANDISIKMQELENMHYKMEVRPFFLVSAVEYEEMTMLEAVSRNGLSVYDITINSNADENETAGMLWITVSNSTGSLITVRFKEAINEETRERIYGNQVNNVLSKSVIPGNESRKIGLFAPVEFWKKIDDKKFTYEFALENRFAACYQEDIDMVVSCNTKIDPRVSEKDQKNVWYCAYNYRIGRWEDERHLVPEEL